MKKELKAIFSTIENLPFRNGEIDLEELTKMYGAEAPIYDDVYCKLNDIYGTLNYLKKPIIGQFKLHVNLKGCYQANNDYHYTSGRTIEFYDDGKWYTSRVEYDNGYYIYHYPDVELDALTVRIRDLY